MALWARGRNLIAAAVVVLSLCIGSNPASAQSDWKKDWERIQIEAKKEGLIVAGIPARAELRKELERTFKPKFGIELDLNTARGPQNASRIAAEYAAGSKYFDVFMGGSGTYESLVEAGAAEPLDRLFILPEVKDAKNWWGGHVWEDNLSGSRYLYSYIADAGTGGFWYNTDSAKPQELRSFDDFLNPKWKGRIGFLDPRTPGSGQSVWSYLWDIKGEAWLRKLLAQDLFISRDQRQLGDALAKGKLALVLGVSFYTLEGFMTASLPIKELPRVKEGLPSSNGSGVIGVVKNAPHPNAARLFLNWLLSKEGQELYVKVMHQSTRRLDVDTKWLQEHGVRAAKDVMTVAEYHKNRNHLEDKYKRVRIPAAEFAERVLQ